MHFVKSSKNSKKLSTKCLIVHTLTIALLYTSCSTTKKTTTQTNNAQQTERITSTVSTLNVGEVEKTTLTTIHWSPPDSLGNQYPTKTTEQTSERTTVAQQHTTDSTQTTEHSTEQTNTFTQQKNKDPTPRIIAAIILSLGTILIIYIKQKKAD